MRPWRWWLKQAGQDVIEYTLIVALLVVSAIAGLATVNQAMSDVFNEVGAWFVILASR